MGPRLILVRGDQRDARCESMRATLRDRNMAANSDESSPSLIIMNVKASLSMTALMHMLTELIYFVLYMHQQMPCTYEELQSCCIGHAKEAEELSGGNSTPLSNQQLRSERGRERRESKRLKKLLKLKDEIERIIRSLLSSLSNMSNIRSVLILLGASPLRPKHVYEVQLDCGLNDDETEDRRVDKSKADLSRKLIRALISDAATSSADGPMKLFLLVHASSNSQAAPEDFHPKRGFLVSSKKVCRTLVRIVQEQATNLEDEVSSISLSDRSPSRSQDMDIETDDSREDEDNIWYQCLHTVKGLFEGSSTDAS
ncbi:hypothetical protein R1flu_022069 [Riccia fluitans]|uniref:Uncharacterized protein n=1 Tax=Riccia fluitans TaxID=41844 RepID=A0ABD1ZR56_9MARC